MKSLLKKLIPKSALLFYHKTLAVLATLFYNFPSNKLIVIGVTGTKGKTTVCNLTAEILEKAGYKTGLCTTANFKIGDREWINDTKQTMQGRFKLQKLLSRMVREKCKYAVIETSSEGIAQFRHIGINYDVLVFLGLSPEHIESHGSFENYRKAKEEIFKSLSEEENKILDNKVIKKTSIVNLDDENVKYFLKYKADTKIGYSVESKESNLKVDRKVYAKNIILNPEGTLFSLETDNRNAEIDSKLLGGFNVYNSLAAICVGISQEISLDLIKKAMIEIKQIPGRLEFINEAQQFKIIVDYAHEPDGLEKVYKTIKLFNADRIISVLGSAGGGRDKKKRPILGKLAAKYTDVVIITNEDPYDEDPMEIINQVAEGTLKEGKIIDKDCFKILDRKKAIEFAIKNAQPKDLIIITGKGCEQCIMNKNNKKIPWDDRKVVREILRGLKY